MTITTGFRVALLLFPVTVAAQWMPMNNGLPNTLGFVHGINMVGQSDSALFATTNTQVLRSLDDGATWTDVTSGLPAGVRIDHVASNGPTVFVAWHTTPGVATGGMHRSTDNGATWINTDVSIGGNYIVAIHAQGDTIVAYAGTPRLILSTNGGATWSDGPTPPTRGQAIVRRGSDIYLGTDNNTHRGAGLGTTWTQLAGIAGAWSFAADGDALYAGTRPAVLRTTDNGATWTTLNGGLPSSVDTKSMYVDGARMVITMSRANWSEGAYASQDSGATWVAWNQGLPNGTAAGILVARGGHLYASSTGVYRRALTDPVPIAQDPHAARPARPGASIRIAAGPAGSGIIRLRGMAGSGARTIRVFKANGVEILDVPFSGGAEQDGRTLRLPSASPGLHIVEVRGAGFTATRRLVLP